MKLSSSTATLTWICTSDYYPDSVVVSSTLHSLLRWSDTVVFDRPYGALSLIEHGALSVIDHRFFHQKTGKQSG